MVNAEHHLAVCWDLHSGDANRRSQASAMLQFHTLSIPTSGPRHHCEACVRAILGRWDRHVAVHLRRPALMALGRSALTDDLVRCVAAFWIQEAGGTPEHTCRVLSLSNPSPKQSS